MREGINRIDEFLIDGEKLDVDYIEIKKSRLLDLDPFFTRSRVYIKIHQDIKRISKIQARKESEPLSLRIKSNSKTYMSAVHEITHDSDFSSSEMLIVAPLLSGAHF